MAVAFRTIHKYRLFKKNLCKNSEYVMIVEPCHTFLEWLILYHMRSKHVAAITLALLEFELWNFATCECINLIDFQL